ncbi:MAG: hypothetical protein ABI650_03355 [Dokdonella sp.]
MEIAVRRDALSDHAGFPHSHEASSSQETPRDVLPKVSWLKPSLQRKCEGCLEKKRSGVMRFRELNQRTLA